MLRLGVLGLGGFAGQTHVAAFERLDGVRVVAPDGLNLHAGVQAVALARAIGSSLEGGDETSLGDRPLTRRITR